jgi:hypothetical protein
MVRDLEYLRKDLVNKLDSSQEEFQKYIYLGFTRSLLITTFF